MNHMGDLGVVTGLLSQAQLDKAGEISIFVVLEVVKDRTLPLGLSFLGMARIAQVFFTLVRGFIGLAWRDDPIPRLLDYRIYLCCPFICDLGLFRSGALEKIW